MTSPPNRREFLGAVGASAMGAAVVGTTTSCAAPAGASSVPLPLASGDGMPGGSPLIVSTWNFGVPANAAALARFNAGDAHPVDMCEAGVQVPEADPTISSVGYGGWPNADGVVELDACIMRGDTLACGGVAGLRDILHPIAVARRVMDRTRHVLLVGEGARSFAVNEGFPTQNMLTERAANRYAEIIAERALRGGHEPWERLGPEINDPNEDHDTIGMIAMHEGKLAMAVTTSGMAWKLPGRVGDSPIIGAGGYVDDEAGAAVSTGVGEEVIRSCGSAMIVEAMRHGAAPTDAIAAVLRRIRLTTTSRGATPYDKAPQVAFIAVDRLGRVGALALLGGFQYALTRNGETSLVNADVLEP